MSGRAYGMREMADALQVNKSTVVRRAHKGQWPYQDVPVRGGHKRLFIWDGLPADVRLAIAEREAAEGIRGGTQGGRDVLRDRRARRGEGGGDGAAAAPGMGAGAGDRGAVPTLSVRPAGAAGHALTRHPGRRMDWDGATDRQRRCALARAGLCRVLERMAGGMDSLSVTRAARMLVMDVALGTAGPELAAMAAEALDRPRPGTTVSERSLLGWHTAFRLHGETALLPLQSRTRLSAVPRWWAAFARFYQIPSKPSVNDAYRAFAREVKAPPSIHQVRRFLAQLTPAAREQGRMGPETLKTLLPFRRRKIDKLFPNDVWTADGHTFDAEVMHPLYEGRVFRPEITTVLDVRTRMIVGWSVGLAEAALVVLDALRVGMERWGLPQIFYVDNGSGYANAEVRGVLERLGVEITHSIPYASQSRGAMERVHGTVWVPLAKRLPTYLGADMDHQAGTRVHRTTRKALKAGLSHHAIVGWDAFVRLTIEAVDAYNAAAHSTLKASPLAVREGYADRWEPVRVPIGSLRGAMLPREARKVLRGEVRLFNRRYGAPELYEIHDEEVLVAYDIRDDRVVWVYDLQGRLIAEARKDYGAADYFPVARIEAARERQAEVLARNGLVQPGSVLEDRLRAREAGQVKRLAQKIETVTGQEVLGVQLRTGTRTLEGVLAGNGAEDGEARERLARAYERLAALDQPEPFTPPAEAVDRYGLWERIERDGHEDPQALEWARHYAGTDEWRRIQAVYAEPALVLGRR